ncbi:hypothetical protein B0T21DRAFT_357499 [Apiosordaria backusii]|uniref:Uncharacterized protein n=1 Tax=Apiosordaria backusii TaxID=314023 RepID=A0AA40ERM6_9PEZI|nr:hypothetical protein B0T21DRAFT_357499 [Apiosordaria backusii]
MADCDMDMDMMDTSEPSNPSSQNHLSGFQPEPLPSVTGRIPTPIHCSFAAQVRGQNWNEPHGAQLATTPEEPTPMAFDSNGMVDSNMVLNHATVPRCLDNAAAMADWSHIQNRRLPSPISESGGEDSPAMMLDSCSPHPITTSPSGHLSHLTHEHPLLATMRENSPRPDSPNGNGMDVESGSPGTPSPKRGHARSRHTVNSWTAVQPGMKRSFSIGYRADCDKCRMKVPGHFNHIIIS